ncbi:MAG TPA: Sir2 family NAD-dependent protein deacetylase [Candidatus Xenobia bacterium]|jgi:NAD-dependent deacetylase
MRIGPDTRVVVLTGAGISAESGIPTFRARGGLWEQHPVEEVATVDAFRTHPDRVWRFLMDRRREARGAQPNAAHRALARLGKVMGERLLLVTQNVDGLHTRAGSRDVIELHGNIFISRCMQCDSCLPDDTISDTMARHECGGYLRPDIVLFGETIDSDVRPCLARGRLRVAGRRLWRSHHPGQRRAGRQPACLPGIRTGPGRDGPPRPPPSGRRGLLKSWL